MATDGNRNQLNRFSPYCRRASKMKIPYILENEKGDRVDTDMPDINIWNYFSHAHAGRSYDLISRLARNLSFHGLCKLIEYNVKLPVNAESLFNDHLNFVYQCCMDFTFQNETHIVPANLRFFLSYALHCPKHSDIVLEYEYRPTSHEGKQGNRKKFTHEISSIPACVFRHPSFIDHSLRTVPCEGVQFFFDSEVLMNAVYEMRAKVYASKPFLTHLHRIVHAQKRWHLLSTELPKCLGRKEVDVLELNEIGVCEKHLRLKDKHSWHHSHGYDYFLIDFIEGPVANADSNIYSRRSSDRLSKATSGLDVDDRFTKDSEFALKVMKTVKYMALRLEGLRPPANIIKASKWESANRDSEQEDAGDRLDDQIKSELKLKSAISQMVSGEENGSYSGKRRLSADELELISKGLCDRVIINGFDRQVELIETFNLWNCTQVTLKLDCRLSLSQILTLGWNKCTRLTFLNHEFLTAR